MRPIIKMARKEIYRVNIFSGWIVPVYPYTDIKKIFFNVLEILQKNVKEMDWFFNYER